MGNDISIMDAATIVHANLNAQISSVTWHSLDSHYALPANRFCKSYIAGDSLCRMAL